VEWKRWRQKQITEENGNLSHKSAKVIKEQHSQRVNEYICKVTTERAILRLQNRVLSTIGSHKKSLNKNIRYIGQGEAQHRKYKKLKLGGGHVYDLFRRLDCRGSVSY
jgi:hypothetical protein